MLGLPLTHPHSFYEYVVVSLPILFLVVQLGHRVLGLLRNYRDFRDGY
jgi:hypothetical protein